MRTSLSPLKEVPDGGRRRQLSRRRRDPQTTAWVALWISFGIFWVLAGGAAFGAKRYYDTATITTPATLTLEQGIVLFRDAVTSTLINAQDNLSLREGDQLMVGQGARASITMYDGSRATLYSGSELHLTELRKSRFHDDFSALSLSLAKGTARFEVEPPLTKSGRFTVSTPHGMALLQPGSYGVDVVADRTRVSARLGTAVVQQGSNSVSLKAEEKALLSDGGVQGPLPAGDQLVQNGDFLQGFTNWEYLDVDEPGRPVEPGKRMLVNENVNGAEMVVLRFERQSPQETHNETGLTQVLNKDVSDYRSLQLHADVRVDDQSLSGGGYMGYEYPAMIRIRYRDETGAQIDWSHGFFIKNPESRPTPNGEKLTQGQWFSYNVDLMGVKQKPVHLVSIEVLGAGHTFAGMIGNISLIGK